MLKVAVIGAGVMGSLHARIFSELPNTKLVAICDPDRSKGKKLANLYNTKYYSDYKKLINTTSLNAVTIAVPTSLHKKIALDLIKNKIPILVEKPLTPSSKDATQIIKAAQENNIILTIGHIERFNPAVLKLKELIKKGVLGKIVSVAVKRVGLFPPRIKDVNVVTDLAVHDLDIVSYLLEKIPKSVYASGGNGISQNQFDYADIILNFGQANCYLQVNWMTPIKIRTLSLTGTKGYAELDYINQELTLYKSKFKTSKQIPQTKDFKEFVIKVGSSEKIQIKIKKEEPLKLELKNFLDSVIGKKHPLVTPGQGLLAVQLSEMVIKSLKTSKVVKNNI